MHLHAHLAAVSHHGHVGGDDGRHTGSHGGINDLMHRVHVLVVDDGVDRQIGLDAMRTAGRHDVVQVVKVKVIGTVRPHVELTHSKVNKVGTSLDGGGKRLTAAYRRHNLVIVCCHVHKCKDTVLFQNLFSNLRLFLK